jgi:hypothetical protein
MQPHAERDALFRGLTSLAAVDTLLYPGGAPKGLVNASKAGKKTVAGVFDDAAMSGSDCRLNNLLDDPHEPRVRLGLIFVHQPGVASDVGKQNRGKRALHDRPTGTAAPCCRRAIFKRQG